MNPNLNLENRSSLEAIEASGLSEHDRQFALNAERNAEAIADAIYAVVRAVREARSAVFARTARAGATS